MFNYNVPSVADNYVLVTLTSRFPTASKNSDKAKAAAVEDMVAKGATREQAEKTVTGRIALFPDGELQDVKTHYNAFDTYFRKYTVKWIGGRGAPRLLNVHRLDDMESEYMRRQLLYLPARDNFCNHFAETLEGLKRKLGQYYDASMYPTVEAIKEYFRFDLTFQPIADPSQFDLGGLSEAQAETLRKRLSDSIEVAAKDAVKEYRDSISCELSRAVKQLQQGKRLHGSLVTNITDLLAADLNVTQDSNFAAALSEVGQVAANIEKAIETREDSDKNHAASEAERMRRKLAGII